ncbi:MAG: SdpI family protein [Acidobacteriaceae bacterium]
MFLLLTFPILATLYAIPLLCGWVGPNPFYGFRNERTRSDRAVWYRANRIAGISIILAMTLCVVIEFAVPSLRRTDAGHLTSVLIQISALLIANAWTTFRILMKRSSRRD